MLHVFKPVAFCLSKNEIEQIQFYSKNIKLHTRKIQKYNLYVWYIGNMQYIDNHNEFLFSFPQTKNLLDRNIIISIKKDQVEIENDWLGSIPIFYNQNDLIVSTIPNLCLKNKAFNNEALQNYLEFGYSVFEHTPFIDIKFLRYYSKLTILDDQILMKYKDDPTLKDGLFKKESNSTKAIDSIKKYVSSVEKKTSGYIILPTSGGYDSRLLNWAVNDKNRILSFTYGISKNQSKSSEVIYAKKIAKILGTKWEQIELSHCNDFIEDWHHLFGFSVHLHGMYHIEFYKNILDKFNFENNPTLLSGIFGDVWAGSIDKLNISSSSDIKKLGFTHGLNIDEKYLMNKKTNEIIKEYFENNKLYLQTHQFQIISIIRTKLMLISYLLQIPEYFGILVWTPFLNYDVAIEMLNLPKDIRKNRNWQKSFFKEVGLNIEDMKLFSSKKNYLDFEMSKRYKFSPIDENCFNHIIKANKIIDLNKRINNINKSHELFESLLVIFRIRGILKKLGIKNLGYLNHLSNYYTLKAIEKSLK